MSFERRLSEPTTVATDAVLALVCAAAACSLLRHPTPQRLSADRDYTDADQAAARRWAARRWAGRFWTGALGSAAVAAAAGAVAHGTQGSRSGGPAAMAWRIALRCTGLSGALWASGAACAARDGRGQWRAVMAVGSAQVAHQARLGARPAFRSAAAAYGANLAAASYFLATPARRGDRAARLACAAAGVTGAGGIVQALGWGRTQPFNHNDRFHAIQLGAFLLLHHAARCIGDVAGHGGDGRGSAQCSP